MRSHRWKSPLEQAGRLRRITAGWLRGEGIPPGLYLPGDTVIVETRRQIRSGEIVVAQTMGGAPVREAIYLHTPGASVIRFVSPGGPSRSEGRQDLMGSDAVSLQVPASDLTIIGVVMGLRRAL